MNDLHTIRTALRHGNIPLTALGIAAGLIGMCCMAWLMGGVL